MVPKVNGIDIIPLKIANKIPVNLDMNPPNNGI